MEKINTLVSQGALGVIGISILTPIMLEYSLNNNKITHKTVINNNQKNKTNIPITTKNSKYKIVTNIPKTNREINKEILKVEPKLIRNVSYVKPKYNIANIKPKYANISYQKNREISNKLTYSNKLKMKMSNILFKHSGTTPNLTKNIYRIESNFRYDVYSPSKKHAGVCQLNNYWGNTLSKRRGYKWKGIYTSKKVQDIVCADRFKGVKKAQTLHKRTPIVNNLTVYMGHQQGINGSEEIIEWITGQKSNLKISLVSTLFNNLPRSKQKQIMNNSNYKKPVLRYSSNRKQYKKNKRVYRSKMRAYMNKIYKSYKSTIVYTWLKIYDRKMYA